MRTALFVIACLAYAASAILSVIGLLSLFADDYYGIAGFYLGLIGLTTTLVSLAFSIVAFEARRQWPFYVVVAATLLAIGAAFGLPGSIAGPFDRMPASSVNFEVTLGQNLAVIQLIAFVAMLLLFLRDTLQR